MRWPNGPRYVVGKVTGTKINPGSNGGGQTLRPYPVIWYVHDAAYCYRVVLETWDEQEARKVAAQKERDDA